MKMMLVLEYPLATRGAAANFTYVARLLHNST